MSTNLPTARQIALMQLHALSCREYVRETPSISREELREIVRKCEAEMPELAKFRASEPSLSDLSNDLLDEQIRRIQAIEYN